MTKPPAAQRRKKRPTRKPTHYRASTSVVDPIVVSTTEAMRMGCWGKTKLFELIAAGELESFFDGSVRRITVASIHARIQRKLQESVKSAQPVEAGSAPDQMPEEIRAAIKKARGEGPGSLEDEEYRRRLQDKFGDRWRVKQIVEAKVSNPNNQPISLTDESVRADDKDVTKVRAARKRRRPRAVHVIRFRTTDGATGEGVEREIAVDVPKFRFVCKDEFDNPWHLALWAPNDPDGPTVLLNEQSPFLIEAIRYHQEQYPEIYGSEVEKIVRTTYGEVAVCKVAHSQKLIAQIPEEELDATYRSEAALTVSLMGLLAEESLIAQRLGKLGRKRTAA